MGHENAHAVARHSAERMSRAIAVTISTGIVDAFTGGAVSKTRDVIGQITGVDVVDSTLNLIMIYIHPLQLLVFGNLK